MSRWVAAVLAVSLVAPATAARAEHGGSSSGQLEVVGHLDRAGLGMLPGDTATDLWAHGGFAYIGTVADQGCPSGRTGVRIVDISDPSDPEQVGLIRSPEGTRANDMKVAHLATPAFRGEVLVHTIEPCVRGAEGGISIYDVSDPARPKALAESLLGVPVHNTFVYRQGERAYLLAVDNVSARDVRIVEITDPSRPQPVAATGQPDWSGLEVIEGTVTLHDVWALEVGDRVFAYLSYWDAGLVMLDITDPARPVYLGDSAYRDPDPLSGDVPEGNGHTGVPTADGRLVITGDEDDVVYRMVLEFEGVSHPATEATFSTPIASLPGDLLTGKVIWTGGRGCSAGAIRPASSPEDIALVLRGACPFHRKARSAAAKGYAAAVVANEPGDDLVTMGAPGGERAEIPALLVGESTGEAMRTASPNGHLSARSIFNGSGYLRVLDVTQPEAMVELGRFATENVFADPPPPGRSRTMHNAAVRGRRAYISWYGEGMRVVDFSSCRPGRGESSCTPTEVAHFVDDRRGSDFWGVYLHDHPDGRTYILGSDRQSGLWVFALPETRRSRSPTSARPL
ncbi:MAG: PA domain-containing protein [Acidimicrobiia bacterium]